MNIIVYFGMGYLPDKNAVANRELVYAEMIKKINYKPVLIGINNELEIGDYRKYNYKDIICYDVAHPITIKQRIRDNFEFYNTIKKIFNEVGVENIKCFIMQDYQIGPMKKLDTFCKNNNIQFIPDLMDWFTPNSDYNIFKNIFKTIDTLNRMWIFYPKLQNKICISNQFKDFFDRYGGNNIVLPCTNLRQKKGVKKIENKRVTIAFVGNPGKHLNKEKIDWVIKALYDNNSSIKFKIIGVDEETILKNNPNLQMYITDNIIFFGKLTHTECIEVLQNTDFSIVIRKKDKLSTYGLSSKICEAFSYKIPVLCTDVGDNRRYIQNGVTGYICKSNYHSVKKMLADIENISINDIKQMSNYIEEYNPLDYQKYIELFNEFITRISE